MVVSKNNSPAPTRRVLCIWWAWTVIVCGLWERKGRPMRCLAHIARAIFVFGPLVIFTTAIRPRQPSAIPESNHVSAALGGFCGTYYAQVSF